MSTNPLPVRPSGHQSHIVMGSRFAKRSCSLVCTPHDSLRAWFYVQSTPSILRPSTEMSDSINNRFRNVLHSGALHLTSSRASLAQMIRHCQHKIATPQHMRPFRMVSHSRLDTKRSRVPFIVSVPLRCLCVSSSSLSSSPIIALCDCANSRIACHVWSTYLLVRLFAKHARADCIHMSKYQN